MSSEGLSLPLGHKKLVSSMCTHFIIDPFFHSVPFQVSFDFPTDFEQLPREGNRSSPIAAAGRRGQISFSNNNDDEMMAL